MDQSKSNILFIVWDACRFDYALEHAPNLLELGEKNLWFEKAITPAPWSPPAHASLFTGKYPHEHGMNQLGDSLEAVTLAAELGQKGYTCYGVSANGFACQRTGFHTDFDQFYYSRGRERYPEALNVSGYALSRLHEDSGEFRTGVDTVTAAVRSDHKLKSFANIAAVGIGSAAVRWRPLQRIPHPLFVSDSAYNYSPQTNTQRLTEIIKREASTEQPFFAFANYMDTHRPYNPPEEMQRKHLDQKIPPEEIRRLNDEVADPWGFVSADARDEIDEEDIETLRSLYAGEVETADTHLGQLLDILRATDQLSNTLIVVTSDHGENLGETDEMGRRRIGHESSISDALARVPLVVAHPEIDSRVVSQPYSLTNLYQIFTEGIAGKADDRLFPPDRENIAVCQYPATGGKELYEKHPAVPTAVLDHRVKEHSVAVYHDNWRVVVETTGQQWAFKNGGATTYEDAPSDFREKCEQYFLALQSEDTERKLDEEQQTQLEALGYM
ncbi:sulfatase-like hydrolase/transferase [Halobacteriaceae archaeon SHR40]|uniref:sulfatase-like hydrolase/transferase n=1 Tax=Halovenus amylolytica TaxID=2500550 RepID=UPI000FE41040